MAQRFARAVLALLCAVAVVYGTAMFPPAFDVQLESDSSGGPDAVGIGQSGTDAGPGPGSQTDTPTGDTETESSTTESPTETSTPSPAASDSTGDEGSGSSVGFLALLLSFAGLVVFSTLALLATAAEGTRYSLGPLPLPGVVSRLAGVPLRRIPQVTTLLVVSAGGGLARLADDLSVVSGALVQSLAAVVSPTTGALGRGLVGFPAALGELLAAPARSLGSAGGLFGNLGSLDFLRGGVSRAADETATPSTDVRTASDTDPATDDDGDEPVTSVTEAWAAMTDLVPVRNPETTTATEFARRAIDAGLPAAPVERLTALFREVRYGGRPDSEDRVAAARRALDALTGGEE